MFCLALAWPLDYPRAPRARRLSFKLCPTTMTHGRVGVVNLATKVNSEPLCLDD